MPVFQISHVEEGRYGHRQEWPCADVHLFMQGKPRPRVRRRGIALYAPSHPFQTHPASCRCCASAALRLSPQRRAATRAAALSWPPSCAAAPAPPRPRSPPGVGRQPRRPGWGSRRPCSLRPSCSQTESMRGPDQVSPGRWEPAATAQARRRSACPLSCLISAGAEQDTSRSG